MVCRWHRHTTRNEDRHERAHLEGGLPPVPFAGELYRQTTKSSVPDVIPLVPTLCLWKRWKFATRILFPIFSDISPSKDEKKNSPSTSRVRGGRSVDLTFLYIRSPKGFHRPESSSGQWRRRRFTGVNRRDHHSGNGYTGRAYCRRTPLYTCYG